MPVVLKQPVFLITFVVILGRHTPQDVPIPSIHNVIATAMSICVALQQNRGFSRLPQPIKRHEALKNDVESGGLKCVKKTVV